jgi:hypothetical protein
MDAKASRQCRITPQKMTLTVELPAGQKDNKSYLEKIRVVINAKDIPLSGSGEVRPVVELPEGASLVHMVPALLHVTTNGK